MDAMKQNKEAFVYCWTDLGTNKLYVGVHKGTPDDGYVCSSKIMKEEYTKRSSEFSRQIIASGSFKEMYVLETAILRAAGADKDPGYYNQHLNNGKCYRIGPRSPKERHAIAAGMMGIRNSFGTKRTVEQNFENSRRQKISRNTPEWKIIQSEMMKKVSSDSKWKSDVSIRMKGRKHALGFKHPQMACPHCGITGGQGGMKRYHFSNCKMKSEVTFARP